MVIQIDSAHRLP